MFGALQPTVNSFRDQHQLKANKNIAHASSVPMSSPGVWSSDDASLTPDNSVPRASTDDSSAYWSTRSRLSFRSIFTSHSLWSDSTGFRSQNGATWRQELVRNMNSGFGPGAPRNNGYRGVQEGRERGGFLPSFRGVGRLGKSPIEVPEALAEAAKEKPSDITLRRFEELRDWMTGMETELVRSSLEDEGPESFVLNSIRKDLYAVQAEWQRVYKEMHGEQCSDIEGKIEKYRAGPEMYHRAAVGAIREDISAYNRSYGKIKYSKMEMATHQKQLAGMSSTVEWMVGSLPMERKARVYLQCSKLGEILQDVDAEEALGLISNMIVEASSSEAKVKLSKQEGVLRVIERWLAEIRRLEEEVQDREALNTSAVYGLKRLNNVKLDLARMKADMSKLVVDGTYLEAGERALERERRYQRARKIALIKELLNFDDEVRLIDGEAYGLQSYMIKEGHPNSLRKLLQVYEESPVAHTLPHTE